MNQSTTGEAGGVCDDIISAFIIATSSPVCGVLVSFYLSLLAAVLSSLLNATLTTKPRLEATNKHDNWTI